MAIINGSIDNDVLTGTVADDLITGFGGDDKLYGHFADDTLNGSQGNDQLYGQENGDTLNGGGDNDILDGGAGADTLNGGAGIDAAYYYNGSTGVTVVIGGVCVGGDAAGDVVGVDVENIIGTAGFSDSLTGSAVANVLLGYGSDDALHGLEGGDTLIGGAGDDNLFGGAGADVLNGGTGIDTIFYSSDDINFGVTVTIGGVGAGGEAQGDTIGADIENIWGTGWGDVLTGSAAANVLKGETGLDKLFGLGGNDTLEGGESEDVLNGGAGGDKLFGGTQNDVLIGGIDGDVLDGGAGIDTADFLGSLGNVTASLATGTGTSGDGQGDTFIGIENLAGSDMNDSLSGNASANVLQGRGGHDLLNGGAGADTLIGGDGIDTASYGASLVGVDVSLATGVGSGGDAQGDTLASIENLSGTFKNDVLAGDGGINALQGFGGDDLLRGGMAADAFDGGADVDTVSYHGSAAAVSVSLATGKGAGGEAQGDTLLAIENLIGGQQNDGLEGNAGANTLQGWGGNDALVGGKGKDTLTGGIGADRFYFTAPDDSMVGAGADVITDFSHGQADRIDLHLVDADTTVFDDQAFSFIGTGLYTGVAGQLRYAVVNGVTTAAGDVNGDKVSDFHIQLTGIVNLVASDFVL